MTHVAGHPDVVEVGQARMVVLDWSAELTILDFEGYTLHYLFCHVFLTSMGLHSTYLWHRDDLPVMYVPGAQEDQNN